MRKDKKIETVPATSKTRGSKQYDLYGMKMLYSKDVAKCCTGKVNIIGDLVCCADEAE